MSVDERDEERPLKRPPLHRPPQSAQPPPPPRPNPPDFPPPHALPPPPPQRTTQRAYPPPPPPPQEPVPRPPPRRQPLPSEKASGFPLSGIIIAIVGALFGLIAAMMAFVNPGLALPLLAAAIAVTNAANIVVLFAIWRIKERGR